MIGLNIRFKGVIWKVIPKLSLLLLLAWNTVILQTTLMLHHAMKFSTINGQFASINENFE